MRVKLSDVIKRCQTKVDRYDTDLEYYVGGEHFESGEIDLNERGLIRGSTIGPMFYYGFKQGDFLLVSRNPHLRKAALATFDGVCSEKTFVLETKDPNVLIPEYLPWVLQNANFWDYAHRNRHGSTNFFINWSTLAKYEFELPAISEQRAIASVMWSAQEVKRKYKSLLKTSDELVKSRFVEMFGDPVVNPRFEKASIGKLANVSSGATPSRKKPEYYEGTIPWVKTGEVAAGNVTSTEEHITEEAVANSACHILPRNTILVAMYGQGDTRGKAALLMIEAATNQACAALEFNDSISPVFALAHLRLCYEDLRALSHGGNQKNLSLQIIKGYRLEVPPLELQQEFAGFVAQVDKSKFALKESMKNLDSTMSELLNRELGLSDV